MAQIAEFAEPSASRTLRQVTTFFANQHTFLVFTMVTIAIQADKSHFAQVKVLIASFFTKSCDTCDFFDILLWLTFLRLEATHF